MFIYLILEVVSGIVGAIALLILIVHLVQKPSIHDVVRQRGIYIPAVLFVVVLISGFLANRTYAPDFAMPLFMHSHAPGGLPPSIPFSSIINFLWHRNDFVQVADISADPKQVPSQPHAPDTDGVVRIHLVAQEVVAEIAPGISFNYWTYNRQVPGPMLRVREGDTIELTLTNSSTSLHHHNIDLHAVNGPGGGATLTHVAPGETKSFRWKALNPGLYVYHCAMPNVSTHNSHGQYGLILVDPKNSTIALSPVDREFYIMQGELYTVGQIGKRGLVPFDSDALLSGNPNYVVFNGKIEGVPRLQAQVGEKIRIYIGNGGVNLISSFHVIGEIFDTVYPEAALGVSSTVFHNVQTTAVLPGGAAIVEFTVDVPGKYLLVDHALARMNKGAWAVLEVGGQDRPMIFGTVSSSKNIGHQPMIMHHDE
jgi:nitrite reductase (NO-forming)